MKSKPISPEQAVAWLELLRVEAPEIYPSVLQDLSRFEDSKNWRKWRERITETLQDSDNLVDKLNQHLLSWHKIPLKAQKNKSPQDYNIQNGLNAQNNSRIRYQRRNSNLQGPQDLLSNSNSKNGTSRRHKQPSSFYSRRNSSEDSSSQGLQKPSVRSSGGYQIEQFHQLPAKRVKQSPGSNLQMNRRPNALSEKVSSVRSKNIYNFPQFLSINQELTFFKSLRGTFDPETQVSFNRILHLFAMNIITLQETIQCIEPACSRRDIETLTAILESRETDRRQQSCFKPLTNLIKPTERRQTPSYVISPPSYPSYSAKPKNPLLNSVLVSVSYGSQETFNVRKKSQWENLLLKSEEQQFQFHLLANRLKETIRLFEKLKNIDSGAQKQQINHIMKWIGSLDVLKYIYGEPCLDDQKELEEKLHTHTARTSQIILQRLNLKKKELEEVTSAQTNKHWVEIAAKNFHKALDVKSYEFKDLEKQRIKPITFINELEDRMKCYESLGIHRSRQEDVNRLMMPLNTFALSSRTQSCKQSNSCSLPQALVKPGQPFFTYPTAVMYFGNRAVCSLIFSMSMNSFDSNVLSESQRFKHKLFFKILAQRFLGMTLGKRRGLHPKFDEAQFTRNVSMLGKNIEESSNQSPWLHLYDDEYVSLAPWQAESQSQFHFEEEDSSTVMGFIPTLDNYLVLYCSDQVYVFLRFLYTIYERMLKLFELFSPSVRKAFEVLYYCCLRSRESLKFEEVLYGLLGPESYLFAQVPRFFEGLVKSIGILTGCYLTRVGLQLLGTAPEAIYRVMVPKIIERKNGISHEKILRIVAQMKDGKQTGLTYIYWIDLSHSWSQRGKDESGRHNLSFQRIQEFLNDLDDRPIELPDKDSQDGRSVAQVEVVTDAPSCLNIPQATSEASFVHNSLQLFMDMENGEAVHANLGQDIQVCRKRDVEFSSRRYERELQRCANFNL